jgi:hypothetical protein
MIPDTYLANILVDTTCKDDTTTRFIGPALEISLEGDSPMAVEDQEVQTSSRRLQSSTTFTNVSNVWTNSAKYYSRGVSNLFDKD